jgi:hypothetical protein
MSGPLDLSNNRPRGGVGLVRLFGPGCTGAGCSLDAAGRPQLAPAALRRRKGCPRPLANWRAWVRSRSAAAREELTIRDIGIWSHYVGDASQPLHVSIHYNGWGDYPNPHWYTVRKIHAYFEGEFVKRNLARSAVAAEVGPHRSCCRSIDEETRALLLASLAQVGPLYALENEGGFKRGDERGIAFATKRLAAGAEAVRDMIVAAWLDGANTPVGYPW